MGIYFRVRSAVGGSHSGFAVVVTRSLLSQQFLGFRNNVALHLDFHLGLRVPLDPDDEGTTTSETSATIYLTTQHNIPEDVHL